MEITDILSCKSEFDIINIITGISWGFYGGMIIYTFFPDKTILLVSFSCISLYVIKRLQEIK
jgi:hypothetical protein